MNSVPPDTEMESRKVNVDDKDFVESSHLEGGELIRQVVFGMNDGIVSTFALLAGVVGAGQSVDTIIVTLLAAMIAGALSMAAGEFISAKSEKDYYRKEIEQERLELILVPEIEKQELRRMYKNKGFKGKILDEIVDTISKDKNLWLKELVASEIGVAEIEQGGVLKQSIIIFFAFVLGAIFPIAPYLLFRFLDPFVLFALASIITFGGLFLAGALKKFVTGVYWLKSGVEMLLVGLFAYGSSYLIGLLIGVNIS